MKILILGINGFIGNSLASRILSETDWEVYGMDIRDDKLDQCHGKNCFHFVEGDISINKEWIEYHVKKCDAVLPLVAIVTLVAGYALGLHRREVFVSRSLHMWMLAKATRNRPPPHGARSGAPASWRRWRG